MYVQGTSAALPGGAGGICPRVPTEKGRRKKGCGNFFAIRNIQKFCELCWGRNGHGRTNHVHRTMHIVNVIGSVSWFSKCNKIVGGCMVLRPRPHWGADSAPQDPLAGFKGPTLRLLRLRGWNGGEVKRRGAKMIYAPGNQKPSRHQCSSYIGQGALIHWFAGRAQFEVTPLAEARLLQVSNTLNSECRILHFVVDIVW